MTAILSFNQYSFPIKAGRAPFHHQVETTKFLLWNHQSYCFNDMGTGKTLSALWAADFLLINEKIRRVLITAPLSTLRAAWGRDILMNLPHRRFSVCHGTKDQRIAVLRSNAEIVIINHDGMKIVENEIIRSNFDLFIIDELTAFKNYSAVRTRVAERIARSMKGVWGLTGAPTPNSPLEAYGQARVVNPKNPYLPKFFTQYRDQVVERINQFIWVPKAGANDRVFKILQPAIRYTREQCLDLPPRLYDTRDVPLTEEQSRAYDKMRKEMIIKYQAGEISAGNAAIMILKLLQIAAGAVKDDEGNVVLLNSVNRLNELYDIFEATPQKKLVVFSAFRAMVEQVDHFFNHKKIKSDIIYGGTDSKLRGKLIEDFQDKDLDVLVIQPQAASHGITLTASSTIVWHSLLHSNEVYNQANDRITRIGQERSQLIIHLIGCKAETRVLKMLENKDAQSKDLLNIFEEIIGT
jgi:SNF2 family DNA or RNA helicase